MNISYVSIAVLRNIFRTVSLHTLCFIEVIVSLMFFMQARGIDVQQVSLVYDLPTNRENYIHRFVLIFYLL